MANGQAARAMEKKRVERLRKSIESDNYDECKLAARKELDLFLVDGMDVLLDKANGKNGSIPQPVKTMKIGKVFSAPASKVTVDIIAALSRLILTAGIIYIAYKVTLHLGT